MTTAVRNVFINLNQFEIVQLVGATESCYEDTKILQFHPGQAIHCRCKVSSNGRDTKSVLSTRGVAATCRLLYPGVLSGADIQKSRSSGIVMLAGKYGILDKNWLGIS